MALLSQRSGPYCHGCTVKLCMLCYVQSSPATITQSLNHPITQPPTVLCASSCIISCFCTLGCGHADTSAVPCPYLIVAVHSLPQQTFISCFGENQALHACCHASFATVTQSAPRNIAQLSHSSTHPEHQVLLLCRHECLSCASP